MHNEGGITMYIPLVRASSFNNGIMFYSKHNPKYVTMITIDEAQSTQVQWLSEKAAQKEEEMQNQNAEYKEKEDLLLDKIIIFMIIPLVLILITYYIDANHALKFLRIFDGIMIPFFLISLIAVIIIASFLFVALLKNISTSRHKFHAAEHMIVNAYSKLHRIPSLEELRKYSRFSTRCGTNKLLTILNACIISLISLLFKLDSRLLFIVMMILCACILFGLLNFVQILVTEPPTDRELNVAIEGLKAWLENEQEKQGK